MFLDFKPLPRFRPWLWFYLRRMIYVSMDPPPDNPRPRARQNVIMELGYFLGRLGRVRVCALYKGDVELPSDYQGVLDIDMDLVGAWKAKLAQEFVEAKLPINLSGLLAG